MQKNGSAPSSQYVVGENHLAMIVRNTHEDNRVFSSNKGGVGKTSMVYPSRMDVPRLGHCVLAVDLDPAVESDEHLSADESELEKLWPEGNILTPSLVQWIHSSKLARYPILQAD